MPPFPIFLFSLFLLLLQVTPYKQHIDTEKNALLEFINNLDDHDKTYNWNDRQSESPCSWKGVLCDPTNTTVIQLSMPSAGLTGNLKPWTLAYLDSLLVLSLQDNKLSGSIPIDFFYLTLSELYLQDNNFSGYLSYIDASELESFNVSNNDFNCTIPYSLYYKFPNQSEFIFSGNPNLCLKSSYYCDFTYDECPLQYNQWRDYKIRRIKNQVTVSVSVVLGLPLLVFLCWLPKKINKPRKPSPGDVDSGTGSASTAGLDDKKLVFMGDGIIGSFDYEDLLPASGEVLGKGSVGTSYKAVVEEKEVTVVVKRLKDGVVTQTEFESQMEVLGKMKSEHVVTVKAYYYSDSEKFLVYDYFPTGSLFARLHGHRGLSETRLNSGSRLKIALNVGKGLAYLHANNVVHGNIKSSNVLIRQETDIDVVVSDYYLYKLVGNWRSINHQFMTYWAPEVCETKSFSFESDMYSFGVLLLELLTGKDPNYQASKGSKDISMWVQLLASKEPHVEMFDVELMKDQNIKLMFQMLQIAKECVSVVPNHRPTMEKVVSLLNEMNHDEANHCFGQPIIGL